MSDDDLVERVARAMETKLESLPFVKGPEDAEEQYCVMARTALASIEAAGYVVVPRKRTEAMKRVVIPAGAKYPARAYWSAMLDAALEKDKANVG